MARLSGFPELLPGERIVEQQVLDHLRRVFELHGFVGIETRAVEPVGELLRKGEIDKEVYGIRRLLDQSDGAGETSTEADELALHFDLTVPFARYVVEHANDLSFPFRRYQIQKVWRGERPQQGRFREFTQADIDVVGRDVLPFGADVEVARVMAEALAGLPVPPLTMQVNNRKLLEGYFRGVGASDIVAVMRAIDRLDKVPRDVVADQLVAEAGLTVDQADRCLALTDVAGDDVVEQVRALGVADDLLDEGLAELQQVLDGTSELGVDGVRVVADLRIARGLDYYTGTVFETRMAGYERLGSICSGGRYDQLARDNRSTYPGVGISLGVSRLLVPLFADGLTADRSVPSAVLVALLDDAAAPAARAVATALRSRGIPTEVALRAQKLGQQIKLAERRGIPYVWFVASPDDARPHEVKDIRTGAQIEADPLQWEPAGNEAWPGIRDASGLVE